MCAEDFKTSFSYFNLGVASYHLGEFEEAEKVLSITNYMDPTHAPTWAYICLTLLKKKNPPLFAAYQTMNESIKLGLRDSWVLHEIALAWVDLNSFKASKEAFEQTIMIIGTQKVPGQKTIKKLNDYFAACTEINTCYSENINEMKEKLSEEAQKVLSNKHASNAIGDMIETYQQLLCGDLVIKDGDDFLEGRL